MSYGHRLTLSCDWPTGLDLNIGAPPSERCDVVGSGCLCAVMPGIKLVLWIVGFYPLTYCYMQIRLKYPMQSIVHAIVTNEKQVGNIGQW